jgi:nicotinic acid mononucleotide adenylyltransferase
MGVDYFINLFKWTRPEEIINTLTKLYVVPRDFEHTDYEDQIKKVKNIAPNLQLIFLPDHPFRKLSSSSFRTLK